MAHNQDEMQFFCWSKLFIDLSVAESRSGRCFCIGCPGCCGWVGRATRMRTARGSQQQVQRPTANRLKTLKWKNARREASWLTCSILTTTFDSTVARSAQSVVAWPLVWECLPGSQELSPLLVGVWGLTRVRFSWCGSVYSFGHFPSWRHTLCCCCCCRRCFSASGIVDAEQ